MTKFQVFGATTKAVSKREIEHMALARHAAAEGIVLLKNDGILPLAPQRIALYGPGSRMTVKGGSGSGEVNERHSVSIEEGLKNAGFTFSTLWMDRFEKKFQDDIAAWRAEVDTAIKKYNVFTTMAMFNEIGRHPKPNPSCTPVLQDELVNDTDIAVYVLSRQAGEGQDRKVEKGDYLLSDMEVDSLKLLSAHYKKLILVINSGGPVDLNLPAEVRVDALLFFGQGGMEGGNALADIFTGKVTPSGRLTDTWALRYEDCPSHDTYSHMNGNLEDEEYYEGIYVGYRYFSTFEKKVRFPFGYGLSYTKFATEFVAAKLEQTIASVNVKVRNLGERFAGREVVQLYASKPCDKYDCEKFSLVAFSKTSCLTCGAQEELQLQFDVRDLAIYDSAQNAFVLPKGEYGLYFGSNVQELSPCAVIVIDEDVATEKVTAVHDIKLRFTDLKSEQTVRTYSSSLPRLAFDSKCIQTKLHRKYIPQFPDKIKKIAARLTEKQKIMLVVGGGYKLKSYNAVMGAAGRTNTKLLKVGVPNIIMADGPAGLNVTQATVILKSGSPRFPEGVPEMWQWGWLRKFGFIAKAKPEKGRPAYRYMTAWPSETVQAQSWDISLLEKIGAAVGREMIEIGVSVWLAPGMNIHRNPLCGRNFEYYSEDPLVSGKMAAAITRGVQSAGGVGVSVKHFCCNNQEDNRYGVSENVSQRAMRELYLRAFRIAITEGRPWTVMSCYNRVNGTYVCNSRALVTGVLRDEWGFDGLVMSDWSAVDKCSYAGAINAGNDMIMPGHETTVKKLAEQNKAGELDKAALDISVMRVLELIFKSEVNKNFPV